MSLETGTDSGVKSAWEMSSNVHIWPIPEYEWASVDKCGAWKQLAFKHHAPIYLISRLYNIQASNMAKKRNLSEPETDKKKNKRRRKDWNCVVLLLEKEGLTTETVRVEGNH